MKHRRHNCRAFCTRLLAATGIFSIALAARAVVPWTNNINTNNIITVTNATYGANVTNADNAAAIQSAITAASAGGNVGGLLGGTVRVPPGTYLCGPLTLNNYVNLQLDAGAILQALPYGTYPGSPYTTAPAAFITANGLHDVSITGQGAIDGQGDAWWTAYNANSALKRFVLASFQPASSLLLGNVTFSNSPSPNIVIKGNGGNVTLDGVSVKNPATSPNTDAIDFAETNTVIRNCTLDTGDDNIAFGSSGGMTRDILVTNCTFLNGHG